MRRQRFSAESLSKYAPGIADDDAVGRYVFRNDRPRGNDAALADPHALKNRHAVPNPDVAFNDRRLEVWPACETHRVSQHVYWMVAADECHVGREQAVVPYGDVARQMGMSTDIDVVTDRHMVWVNEEAIAAGKVLAERPKTVAVRSNSEPGPDPAHKYL